MVKSERVPSTEAGKWIADHAPGKRRRKKPRYPREDHSLSVKQFVEMHRDTKSDECIFVPGAVRGAPAAVSFCGRNISASRYATLLACGAPKHEGMVSRHACGNGHLSCINPNHLLWGTPADNISDAVKHRHAGDEVADKISAVLDD